MVKKARSTQCSTRTSSFCCMQSDGFSLTEDSVFPSLHSIEQRIATYYALLSGAGVDGVPSNGFKIE